MFIPSLPEERASESMGAEEGDGLTLEGLAHRLETLERENSELRSKVATLEGSDTGRAVEEPGSSSQKRRVSRSWLLRNAGAAAVGTMAAGALLARDASVAKANHFAPGISVDYVITHQEGANLTAVLGNAPNGEGVVGFGKANGVRGEGQTGVLGKSSTSGFAGVSALHTGSGYGVVGDGSGVNYAGVLGRNPSGTGVRAEGGIAIRDLAPTGQQYGYGVVAEGRVGVSGAGFGIAGVGVRGEGGSYGGEFGGFLAQLKLTPKVTAGKPTSGAHTKGEIYLDSAGTLFVCTANGTPGKWRKVTTSAV